MESTEQGDGGRSISQLKTLLVNDKDLNGFYRDERRSFFRLESFKTLEECFRKHGYLSLNNSSKETLEERETRMKTECKGADVYCKVVNCRYTRELRWNPFIEEFLLNIPGKSGKMSKQRTHNHDEMELFYTAQMELLKYYYQKMKDQLPKDDYKVAMGTVIMKYKMDPSINYILMDRFKSYYERLNPVVQKPSITKEGKERKRRFTSTYNFNDSV